MQNRTKKVVLGVVGPTASGKTALSLPLAQALHAEILCMDSMQIYRGMDVGTAKPTVQERALVPHHLLDLLSPQDAFSVTQYADAARPLLDALPCPMLVGGTGLYLQALSLPMDFGTVGGDEKIREKYHALADTQGKGALHALLAARDPATAARLHENDVRRVVRALEVLDLTGVPLSRQSMPGPEASPYAFQLYAIAWPREALYARVDARVEAMLQNGLCEEVAALLRSGVTPEAQSMQGLGYKEMVPVLRGEATVRQAAELVKTRTRHYAKRQLTWFQRDARITWLPAQPDMSVYLKPIIARYRAAAGGTPCIFKP